MTYKRLLKKMKRVSRQFPEVRFYLIREEGSTVFGVMTVRHVKGERKVLMGAFEKGREE